VSDEGNDTRLVALSQYDGVTGCGRLLTVTAGMFLNGLPHLGYMKASQTPHKTNTRAVIIRKDLVSLASCKKTSGKSITLNKQSDADVKTNLNGTGTVISKRNMRGDKSSDMIAALSQI
jgi:hypothetical protein